MHVDADVRAVVVWWLVFVTLVIKVQKAETCTVKCDMRAFVLVPTCCILLVVFLCV